MLDKLNELQKRLDRLSKEWWIYLIFTILFFIPSYASKGYDPQQTALFTKEILSNALIYKLPILFPITKAITILLIFIVFVFGDKKAVQTIFNMYISILYLFIGIFQHIAITETYGFGIITGNVILLLLITLFWLWETIIGRNEFTKREMRQWKLWVLPLAMLSFYFPVNPETITPDFSIKNLFFNKSALTYSTVTPLILATLLLYYPNVNKTLLRVTSYAGIVFGVMNTMTWFLFMSQYWWMMILNLFLVFISVFCFFVSLTKRHRRLDNYLRHYY